MELFRASGAGARWRPAHLSLRPSPSATLKACLTSATPANADVYKVCIQTSGQVLRASPIPAAVSKRTLSEQGSSDSE